MVLLSATDADAAEMVMEVHLQGESYEFIGGPFDGRKLMVANPEPAPGTELVVHRDPPSGMPAEFYVMEADGRFYHVPPPLRDGVG
jgi:hypothetical protein